MLGNIFLSDPSEFKLYNEIKRLFLKLHYVVPTIVVFKPIILQTLNKTVD